MAARKFVHPAASPGLVIFLEDGKFSKAHAFGEFKSIVYIRESNKSGYKQVQVTPGDPRDYVKFNDLIMTDPEPEIGLAPL